MAGLPVLQLTLILFLHLVIDVTILITMTVLLIIKHLLRNKKAVRIKDQISLSKHKLIVSMKVATRMVTGHPITMKEVVNFHIKINS